MTKYNVGIIGNGFVGSATAAGFSPVANMRIYDKDPLKATHSLNETVNESDIVFVSVPTPMNSDGSINLGIIESVFEDINRANKRSDNVIVLKSTVVPGTTVALINNYRWLNITYNPEFLTERKANFDFVNQSRVVLGGNPALVNKVAKLFKTRFMHCNVVATDTRTAEFIKYFGNVFFAVKVSFANEMKRMAVELGVDWEQALYGFVADGRVADSHLHVPGPDGKLGFGGSCFPKDLNAFINLADNMGINVNVLKAAWQTNLEVRPEKDWENLTGRAVSFKNKGEKNENN
tara:strand:+ start:501 stop:1373 length:873 start_codon:yes stop_codon:yes gene_type:complete